MEDFPARIADFLESVASRIRSMTVDPLARVIKWVSLGLAMAALAIIAAIFLFVGAMRALGELIGSMTGAYAIAGGLFGILGVFLWGKRFHKTEDEV